MLIGRYDYCGSAYLCLSKIGDGPQLLGGTDDGSIMHMDSRTGKYEQMFSCGKQGHVRCITVDPAEPNIFYAGCSDILVWDIRRCVLLSRNPPQLPMIETAAALASCSGTACRNTK
jgi:WD40 repeat protein